MQPTRRVRVVSDTFMGSQEASLDPKNRVLVPQVFRSQINGAVDGEGVYVFPGEQRGTFELMPDRWYQEQRKTRPGANLLSSETLKWLQFLDSQTVRIVPDAQGRLLLPEILIRNFRIAKEIVFVGAGDRLVLWSKPEYDAFVSDNLDQYAARQTAAREELRQLELARQAAAKSN